MFLSCTDNEILKGMTTLFINNRTVNKLQQQMSNFIVVIYEEIFC